MKTQRVVALLLLLFGLALLDTDQAFANAAVRQIAKGIGNGVLRVAPGLFLGNGAESSADQDVRERSEEYPRYRSERRRSRYDEPYSYDNEVRKRRLREFEGTRYCNLRRLSGYGPDYRNCEW